MDLRIHFEVNVSCSSGLPTYV